MQLSTIMPSFTVTPTLLHLLQRYLISSKITVSATLSTWKTLAQTMEMLQMVVRITRIMRIIRTVRITRTVQITRTVRIVHASPPIIPLRPSSKTPAVAQTLKTRTRFRVMLRRIRCLNSLFTFQASKIMVQLVVSMSWELIFPIGSLSGTTRALRVGTTHSSRLCLLRLGCLMSSIYMFLHFS